MSQPEEEQQQEVMTTLGEELKRIRQALGFSLRAVEELSGISNAYLSQLETGKIEKPSPNYLYKLAEVYNVPYESLMEKAGYIVKRDPRQSPAPSLFGAALATIDDLSPEEQAEVMNYIAFLRSKRPRKE